MKTEKVTLPLNRKLLEKQDKTANMNPTEYVRYLISKEGNENNVSFEISKEILELKGCLAQNESSSKRNIHKATQKMHRTKN